jgi:hypothetical protein
MVEHPELLGLINSQWRHFIPEAIAMSIGLIRIAHFAPNPAENPSCSSFPLTAGGDNRRAYPPNPAPFLPRRL